MPYEFIFDLLHPLPVRTKKMFGTEAIYIGEKIVLALRQQEKFPEDNGIWIGTRVEYHPELFAKFSSLRNLSSVKIKSWLLLPEEAPDFEETASELVDLFKQNSELIGVIPKSKNKRK